EYNRVSSAKIWINGQLIFRENDFNQQVAFLEEEIDVYAENEITVLLKSKPNSALKITVYCTDDKPPTITIISPENETLSTNNTPQIAIEYNDIECGVDLSSLQILINNQNITNLFTIDSSSATWIIPPQEALSEGINTIKAVIADRAENFSEDQISFTIDISPPEIIITSPGQDTILNITPVQVEYTADSESRSRIVALDEGLNEIIIDSTDAAGNRGADTVYVTLDTIPPLVEIMQPNSGCVTNNQAIDVEWKIDGIIQSDQLTELLVEGDNSVIRTAVDEAGNVGADTVTVTLDAQPPVVEIIFPPDGYFAGQTPVEIQWSVDGILQTEQTAEALQVGINKIVRSATDAAGNYGADSVSVQLGTLVPDAVGMTIDTADSIISGAYLKRGTTAWEYKESIALGRVISQNPQAGDTADINTKVDLAVSFGPPSADLAPVSIDISGIAVDGQSLEMNGIAVVKIINCGTNTVYTNYSVTLFEDSDYDRAFSAAGDNILARTINFMPHNPGDTLFIESEIIDTAQFKGNLISAFDDSENEVPESDESNNCINSMHSCMEENPPSLSINPVIEWKWSRSEINYLSDEIMTTPVVANLTDDNNDGVADEKDMPDIVIVTFDYDGWKYAGTLRALSGDCGKELFTVASPLLFPPACPAIGDIDED
ncbi:MAG: PASTA domain-containing protein, partial [Chitinivibrionales bacterium]|nr:PASTA domain-containing protein [Chitinivibrionales bacterium]